MSEEKNENTPVEEAKTQEVAAKAEVKEEPKKEPAKKPAVKAKKKTSSGTPATIYSGRRKVSVARVKFDKGSGNITVNKKPIEEFFRKPGDIQKVKSPLELTGTVKEYDIKINVKGGGTTGQAEAVRMGIARGLDELNPDFHKALRTAGLLTRDSRMVERKKYGLHKARRATQFSKR